MLVLVSMLLPVLLRRVQLMQRPACQLITLLAGSSQTLLPFLKHLPALLKAAALVCLALLASHRSSGSEVVLAVQRAQVGQQCIPALHQMVCLFPITGVDGFNDQPIHVDQQ